MRWTEEKYEKQFDKEAYSTLCIIVSCAQIDRLKHGEEWIQNLLLMCSIAV